MAVQAAGPVTFDSVTTGIVFDQDSFNVGGLLFTGLAPSGGNAVFAGAVVDASDAGLCAGMLCPIGNDSHYYASLNDSSLAVHALVPGGLIHVQGFDASFIGADAGTVYPATAGYVTVLGQLAGGASLSERFALHAGSDGSLSFASYATSAGFAGQAFTSVIFSGYACAIGGACQTFGDGSGQFALDNLQISAVPEPSIWLTMLGGLGLMASMRRRRAA